MLLPLNAFLVKRGVSPLDFVSQSSVPYLKFYLWTGERLETLSFGEDILEAAMPGDMIVAIHERPRGLPGWQEFLQENFNVFGIDAPSASLGAIVFCAMTDGESSDSVRWVAWVFGACSRICRRAASDPRFGLTVTLNTLAAELLEASNAVETLVRFDNLKPRLNMLKYKTTAPYFQQTGHQASRDIPVDGFRVDRYSDLVSAVGGSTTDSLFHHLSGGRSLQFKREIRHVDDFTSLSIEILARSNLSGYKEVFGWIDNISPVEDPQGIADLRRFLVKDLLRDPMPRTVDIMIPDDLPELGSGSAIQYILMPHRQRRNACDLVLTPEMIARLVAGAVPEDRDLVLDQDLRFLDASKQEITSATVLECLCADLRIGAEQYILYDGNFYRVDPDFIRYVDDAISAIESSDLEFPPYRGGTEPAYNLRIKENLADRFVVVDGELIRLPGQTGIEPCDLVGPEGQLVHVKRKGRSSVLSHLFSQAVNSCKMLKVSDDARKQFTGIIGECSGSPELAEEVIAALASLNSKENGIEVVFAFLGSWRGRSVRSLPLFSRIALSQAVESINLMGYRARVKLIDTT